MKKRTTNYYDDRMEELVNTLYDAKARLEGKVNDVITKKNVIDLYPDGPDKNRAIKDFQEAQKSLLCAIGNYDGRMRDVKEFYTENYDKGTLNWRNPDTYGKSHAIVEGVYRNYWNR
jgi:hypothetical protein